MYDMRARLLAIEADLDAGHYRPGTWEKALSVLRQQPRADRLALSVDVSRVSRKLHARHRVRRRPVLVALLVEASATAVGGGVLSFALDMRSNLAALLAAAIWITTFQPLVKVTIGMLAGIRYEYAYLNGIEPRFKMRYGSYLAAPRGTRIAVHLSGMIGSPLAAWLVGRLAGPTLPLARAICFGAGWAIALFNGLLFLGAFTGRRRIRSLRLATTSGGVAGAELREALVDT